MAKKRITSVDVAQRAGVSQSTVSRVLSGSGRISLDTRKRVLAAARQLNYKPNALARSLITQRTNFVGIVMADMSNPFYPNVLQKFTSRLQKRGQQIMLFNVPPGGDVYDILPGAMEYQMEAMIITSATISSAMANECAKRGMTVILFNRYCDDCQVSAVCCDNVLGGQTAADYLLDCGHHRLAYIAGDANTSTNIDRELGFGKRLKQRGVAHYLREAAAYSYQAGHDAAVRLLNRDDPPDAIFCANDLIAMGCLDAARFELGISVPNEVAVMGFDDIPAAAWPTYALTTIRQPVNAMIERSLALLDEYTASPNMTPVLRLEPGRLIERQSTRSFK